MSRHTCHLFDVDGTLVDTAPTIVAALAHTLRDGGVRRVDEAALENMAKGSPLKALKSYGLGDLNSYWRHYDKEVGLSRLYFPDTKDILRELKRRGISVGVVSSLKTRQLQSLLCRFDLSAEFGVVIGWNDCSQRKPSPVPILLALSRLGITPNNATYTGDTESDMTAARSAGVTAIRAGWSWPMRDEANKDVVLLETLDRILTL